MNTFLNFASQCHRTFQCMGNIFLRRISNVPFVIPHRISCSYFERYVFTELTFLELIQLRARMHFLRWSPNVSIFIMNFSQSVFVNFPISVLLQCPTTVVGLSLEPIISCVLTRPASLCTTTWTKLLTVPAARMKVSGGPNVNASHSHGDVFTYPQCPIQKGNAHISAPNGALWDKGKVHCGICGFGLFQHGRSHAGYEIVIILFLIMTALIQKRHNFILGLVEVHIRNPKL